MTRRVIAFEGKPTIDGRLILPGAITVDNESIPVTTDWYRTTNGKATKFERNEDTGEISMDIWTSVEMPYGMNTHVSLFELVSHTGENDVMVIESAVLKGIFLSTGLSAWTEQ